MMDETIKVDDQRVSYSVGLLGVEVPSAGMAASSSYTTNLRLDEIERRILGIEAALPPPPKAIEEE